MAAIRWTVIIFLMVSYVSPKTISKRRLDNFAEMIAVQTKTLEGSDLNGYGGWCGLGGSGEPKDDIDRCCMNHDRCYYKLHRTVCKLARIYIMPYNWTYVDGDILCNEDPEKDACKPKLCGCDKDAVNCFTKYAHQYNKTLKSNDKITTTLDYFIRAYMKGEWIPQSVWTEFEDMWAKMETGKWEFIEKHIPEKYWGTLSMFLPEKFIPESVKEKLGLGEVGKVDEGDLGSGEMGTEMPGEDSAEVPKSLWTKFKDWAKGLKDEIQGKR